MSGIDSGPEDAIDFDEEPKRWAAFLVAPSMEGARFAVIREADDEDAAQAAAFEMLGFYGAGCWGVLADDAKEGDLVPDEVIAALAKQRTF